MAGELIALWKVACAIANAKAGRIVAILPPVIYMGDPRRGSLDISLTSRCARSYQPVYPHLQDISAGMNEDWVYDLTAVFDGNELIYIDFCHVSDNCNQMIAERLADILSSDLNTYPMSALKGFDTRERRTKRRACRLFHRDKAFSFGMISRSVWYKL